MVAMTLEIPMLEVLDEYEMYEFIESVKSRDKDSTMSVLESCLDCRKLGSFIPRCIKIAGVSKEKIESEDDIDFDEVMFFAEVEYLIPRREVKAETNSEVLFNAISSISSGFRKYICRAITIEDNEVTKFALYVNSNEFKEV